MAKDEFDTAGTYVAIKDLMGELVLFTPTEYLEEVATSFGDTVVSLSRNGALSCPAPLTCSGTRTVARYNVSGSNRTTVRITAPAVTLVNQADSSKTLTMIVDSPGTVDLPNSGNPGMEFTLGGAITVNSSTAEGSYEGTFDVTVDYQ